MIRTIRDIWQRRAIVIHLVQKALTSSYRTKSLGFVWALLDPLLFMAVYYLVFGVIMSSREPPFMLHIFVGVISFRFLSTSASQSAGCIRSQSGLIKDIHFPRASLPVSVVLSRLVDFAAAWVVVIPLSIVFGIYPTAYWPLIVPMVAIQVLFVMGFSFITAYIGVFFADIENILRIGLRLWFYLSPVLYDLARVARATKDHPILLKVYTANPMCAMLEAYRAAALHSQMPRLTDVATALGFAVVLLWVGLAIFAHAEGQLAKYV
jgi:ABC-type polysaccharide/polyol phosphate export permease